MAQLKNYTLKTLLLILFLFSAQNILAASFSVQAPKQVVQGNKFRVVYTLQDAEGKGIKVNEIPGATLIYGPSTSTSQSYQIINGKSSSSFSSQYTYMYRADKAGTYTIDGATILVDNKAVKCNGFTIEILPPDKTASNRGNQSQSVQIDDINSQSASKPVNANDIFVRINLSKQSAYEQEAILCTIKLYTKYEISSFMPTLQPSFNGFLIEDLPLQTQLNNIEHVNGQNYMVAELKKCILYPQQSGKLTITSGNYDVSVIQYEQTRSFFGMMRTPVEKSVKMKSNQASVNVRKLPEPKPASFTGAVGNFKISGALQNTEFKTYEAATFKIKISGTGNIKYVKTPGVNFPSQFEVYDPKSTAKVSPSGSNMAGNVSWEYTFMPQKQGDYTIPPVEFSYFNLGSRKYETISTDAFTVHVDKGKGTPAAIGGVAKEEIIQKNTDILHIKTGDLGLSKDHSHIVSSFVYWLWYIIPLLILGTFIYIYRKTIKARSNIQLMKTKKAGKVAKKRLRIAKTFMQTHDSSKFYNEILNAVWGYTSDKLDIPVSNLNKENIANELDKYGASEDLVKEILRILDECEFAQYAPAQSDDQMEQIYNSTSNIMDKLENTRKK